MFASRLARTRGLILLTVVLTVGWQVVAGNVPDRPVPIGILMELTVFGAAMALLLLLVLRPSGERTTFEVRTGAFTTSSRQWLGLHLFWIMIAGVLVGPGPGETWAELSLFSIGVDILIALVAAGGALLSWCDLPRLELRPDGVRVRNLRSVTIPWAALRRGTPLRPRRNEQNLGLPLDQPDLVSPVFVKNPLIPLGWDADPWFVADTIRWYVDHPQDRPAIGTEAELVFLRARLAAQSE
ncbi:hypothetical protein ACFQZ4_36370 [Catellatospora coxensis]|uniref:PH (Pleckstrin Homology) domain-containing protein n=1 Tax=Catellatospora coxensis TaxID=310354 RepID=A0A8J3L1N6_9ACTN|nr:hypothetical protein [Catellatospora coxensis]GIG06966.1 hypothetical protein Cco03nite_36660 [Catellatospora coxensis]